MKEKTTGDAAQGADSLSINELMDANPFFTRREMLGMTGMAGMAGLVSMTGLSALAGSAGAAVPGVQEKKPRIAVCVSYWAAPRSHADWIVNKLIDGYWWDGKFMESRVEVVSVYLHQFELSQLGQKVAKAKGIPVYKTVAETLKLGGNELAVDGVVIVAEHGVFPVDMKGHWLLPRWLIYSQVVRVFEQSKRSVPVFNDKHLSYNWDEAKWMFNKSRELSFPLTGGSSIPLYYRTPEIEVEADTPIKNSIVLADAADEGAIFHAIDVLQCFHERRKGGETGVKTVQSIRGPEVWKWVANNPWADKLIDSVSKSTSVKPETYKSLANSNMCLIEYNDGTKAAVIGVRSPVWSWAGEIQGKDPMVISMVGWPGPFDQYHASNAQPHWITEMMLSKKEPFNAERLLLSTGITNWYMESNWDNGVYSAVGRKVATPFLNMTYKSTRGAQFSKGERPPARPYIRGFSE